ncbi:imidazoleglycerol-phosphate dehydratase HisB [Candidatus Borrarchaeum sp.]|uniref:imidazoleglycerol-phosphate dehydratase HisB n=1 Tax=Candidatus Borrarchaeum sp. TaxID=2846742 RepID=UPI002579653E|nr:imidazoleglycerol-phosphate dehydratase HisB [Candidatus Borrarchaeum sp.]
MRVGKITRKTKETDISVKIELDGMGKSEIDTEFHFLNHLLTALSKHSLIDMQITAKGDLAHHIIEDVGICLGQAFNKALKDKKGIKRFGSAYVPMDDALVRAVVDIGGRPWHNIELNFKSTKVEDVTAQDVYHFLVSFTYNAIMNLHLTTLTGDDNHHISEAAFKALALALKDAVRFDDIQSEIPSTKGVL